MKNKLIILFLILLSFNSKAQQYYFNNRIHLGCGQNGIKVIQRENYYDFIATSECLGLGLRSVFFRLDSVGNLLFMKSVGQDYHNFFSGTTSGLNWIGSNSYLYAGSKDDSTNGSNNLLYKLTSDGDSLWVKEFSDTTWEAALQCRITKDGNIITVAQARVYNHSRDDDIMLLKTDSSGNELWRKTFGGPHYEAPYTIDTSQDGGFFIAGYTQSYGAGSGTIFGNAVILKTDSLGNTLWTHAFGDVYDETFTNGITLRNGGYLAVGMYTTDDGLYPRYCCAGDSKLYLVKVDDSGQTVFEKQYGRSYANNILFSSKELPNGNIISAGWYTDTLTHHLRGVVLEVDQNGDSLWMHTYENLHGPNSDSFLYDICSTSDHGFIATGSILPVMPDTGVQDIWVLKIDSNGCEVSNCLINGLAQENSPMHAVTISPNPSNGIFHIFSENEHIKDVQVFDSYGKEIFISSALPEIDLSNFSSGLFFCRIIFRDRSVKEFKLLKE